MPNNGVLHGILGYTTFYGGLGNDTVYADTTFTLPTDVENLTLTGDGNTFGFGNNSNNIPTGNNLLIDYLGDMTRSTVWAAKTLCQVAMEMNISTVETVMTILQAARVATPSSQVKAKTPSRLYCIRYS
nr:hypothetical protein [Neisseria sicca]